MRKASNAILANPLAAAFGAGIVFGQATTADVRPFVAAELPAFGEAGQAHRDDYHLFFLLEEGAISLEIDFQRHALAPSSVLYISPGQVHRMEGFDAAAVRFWAITSDNLHPHCLQAVEELAPAAPLPLDAETFSLLSDAAALCLKLAARRPERLHHAPLKDSANALVALVAAQYVAHATAPEARSRGEHIAHAFRVALAREVGTLKRPAAYAQRLHLSAAYLNECVKTATGYSVSHHIQQRIILEAKRLLYYSDKSVKEIAADLGYEDYPYFCRLFAKVAQMSPLAFRQQNRA